MADQPSISEFGASFKGFLETVAQQAPAEPPFFFKKLADHFGGNPRTFAAVSEKFAGYEHANVQVAVDEVVKTHSNAVDVLGFNTDQPFGEVTFAQLIADNGGGLMGGNAPSQAPVRYRDVAIGDRRVSALQLGLVLIGGDKPLALLVSGPVSMYRHDVTVEVMSAERADAEAFLSSVRKRMRERNVYRGNVLSLAMDAYRQLEVDVRRVPPVSREQIILQPGVLERIERQAVGFSQKAEALRAARRHLRRGLLLHGPPGTGKTFTAMYLARRMPERTVFIVTGRGAGLIEQACEMARMLEPSTVIIEDVDLIAEDRERSSQQCSPLLFDLLNQMDGLAEDLDVLFVLTTNRPEVLEPALASRPGRIDLAVEVPLPDADCRRRLFELYSDGLKVEADLAHFVARTQGASAAFIRELLRKAALYASDREPLVVRDSDLDEALHELVVSGGRLTRKLLGAATE